MTGLDFFGVQIKYSDFVNITLITQKPHHYSKTVVLFRDDGGGGSGA